MSSLKENKLSCFYADLCVLLAYDHSFPLHVRTYLIHLQGSVHKSIHLGRWIMPTNQ
jgi:hypothetical protein